MSHYEAIVSRYMQRTRRSREAHERAKSLLPRGVSSNFRAVDPNWRPTLLAADAEAGRYGLADLLAIGGT